MRTCWGIVALVWVGGCGGRTAPRTATGTQASPAVSPSPAAPGWQVRAAARLDARTGAWLDEPFDVGENYPCAMTCHTTHPFLLARPLLALPGPVLARARARVEERVRAVERWEDAVPMYGEAGSRKARESLATEAVLNAASLVLVDGRGGGALSAAASRALDHMWAMQRVDGGWDWLAFDLEPWESAADEPWGAALAALAVGSQPSHAAAHGEGVTRLIGFLRAKLADAGLHHRVMLARASLRLPGLLADDERAAIWRELAAAQLPDGGWSLAGWGRGRRTQWPASGQSDGYATAFALLALCEGGRGGDGLTQGLDWLRVHQRADGSWPGRSVNKDAALNQGFMSDAATAYAVMAFDACAR